MSGSRAPHPYRILDATQGDPHFRGRCALTVMAKAPIAGKVKTRLSPPLTAEQAANLNACFLRDTMASLAEAARQAPAEVVVSYTPVGKEAAFMTVLPEETLLLPQRGDGFGERLLKTAEDLFACGFSTVCLIDSDSPTVPVEEFVTAALALAAPGARTVLGPSADGGYYLIGLQRAEPNLFDRISWSTELVGNETMERAREIGLSVTRLAEWYDVDDGASLDRLRQELSGPSPETSGYRAPHTRAYLQTLDRLRAGSHRMETLA